MRKYIDFMHLNKKVIVKCIIIEGQLFLSVTLKLTLFNFDIFYNPIPVVLTVSFVTSNFLKPFIEFTLFPGFLQTLFILFLIISFKYHL